jgi:single-stranded-DNA-specific exonuclease
MFHSKSRWVLQNKQNEIIDLNVPISNVVTQLLMNRGLKNAEQIKKFLNPNLEDLHDPFLFPDMKKVKERINRAIHLGERILVYGDYDADGVTSTTILVETLQRLGAIVDFYIPNRFTEGYGPNEQAFRMAKEADVSLIITVDTGIAAIHEANVAKELGIDLIITDHHEAQEQLPDAYAIIHPKLADEYPFKELAGVGVSFKVAHALLDELPYEYLELAAIGTVADLVPLQDENRIIVHYGLKALLTTKRLGLRALKELARIDGQVNEETIGFAIGPRLNAVGRLQDARPAVELLLADDEFIVQQLASEVEELNKERQKIVSEIANEAIQMIEENGYDQDSVLVVAKEGWNPGVVGIVASRLVNRYYKPAIVLGIDPEKGWAKGSARSIEAFNLFENCMELKDLFISFGGHSQAAGMTLSLENVDQLRSNLNQLAKERLTDDDFVPIIPVDASVNIRDLSLKTIEEIEKLAPFGIGNPKPVFQINDEVPKEIRLIGANLDHLKMVFEQEESKLEVIGFGFGEIYHLISSKSKIGLVGELGINEWNGNKKMQLMLKDIRVMEWQLFDFRGSKHSLHQLKNMENFHAVAIYFQSIPNDEAWMIDRFQCIPASNVNQFLEAENIILVDLPSSFAELTTLLSNISPKRLFIYFKNVNDDGLSNLPTREHFKKFYGFMLQHKQLTLKQREQLARARGWNIAFLDFMIKVFLELQFVRIENGVLFLNPNPRKQDLTESTVYKKKEQELKLIHALYYSSYDDLKNWMNKHLAFKEKEEVFTYGL